MAERKLTVEIVTAERVVHQGQADLVTVPGAEGDMGILPRHMRLLTALRPGEIRVLNDGQETAVMVVAGGFLEVTPDAVTILADAAEHTDEIDEQRAQEALERARKRMEEPLEAEDRAAAFAAIQRARARLRVARRRRRGPLPEAEE